MTVQLRLMRMGKRNRPAFRICAIEKRRPRESVFLENIGSYDPLGRTGQKRADQKREGQKKVRLNKERAAYWISVGAQPSETVLSFLRAEKVDGLIRAKRNRKRRKSKSEASGKSKTKSARRISFERRREIRRRKRASRKSKAAAAPAPAS